MIEQKDYKKLCEEYEKRMGIGDDDPAKDGYLVLVKLLRQQNSYLNEIDIKEMLQKEDKNKATAEYERAKSLWENLSKMIQSVNDLKIELKMEGEQKPTDSDFVPVSAKSIANGTL